MPHALDPVVVTSKTVLMQRCADLVRAGYVMHTQGIVPLDRAASLARKFRVYSVEVGKDARYRRKRAHLGNASLLFWQHDINAAALTFVLLVTAEGEHPAHKLEQLHDARTAGQRLELTGYELVQLTRRGAARPSWSWRMTAQTYDTWRERILGVVRAHSALGLRQAWHSIHRVPGFAPIRAQARKIKALLQAEWKRTRHGAFPCAPLRIPYVRRLPLGGLPLSSVLARNAESR